MFKKNIFLLKTHSGFHDLFLKYCIEYTSPWAGFDLTTLVVIDTDCISIINPTTIRSRPRRLLWLRIRRIFLSLKWMQKDVFFKHFSCIYVYFSSWCKINADYILRAFLRIKIKTEVFEIFKCLSPLKLWDRILLMARCTRYNI
jgi:hypothetical protein